MHQNFVTDWHRSGVFIVNLEHISHLFLVFYIVEFEHVLVRQWKIFFSRQIHVVWNKSKRIRMGSNSEKYQVFRSFCSLNFTKTDNLRRIREISEISGIVPFSYCDQNIPESFDFFRCERQSIESNLLTVNTGIDFNGYFLFG